MIDIAAIKEAAEKATPGPWNNSGTSVDDFGREYQASLSFEWSPNGTGNGDGINDNHINDASYIALANPTAILSLIARMEDMSKAVAVFSKWTIDVSTLGELADLEARLGAVGVSMTQVGEWSALQSITEAKP